MKCSRSYPDPRHIGPRINVCVECGKKSSHSHLCPKCFQEYMRKYSSENWDLDVNDEYHVHLPPNWRWML